MPQCGQCGTYHRFGTVNRRLRSPSAPGNGEFELPKSFKGAILAPKSPGSGECRINYIKSLPRGAGRATIRLPRASAAEVSAPGEEDMKRFAMITVAALGALLATAPGALAGDTNCTSTIAGTTINGNVVVPNGARCVLDGDKVTGNVTVGQRATLLAKNLTTIAGNVQADHCTFVSLFGGVVVGGNLQIQHCTGAGLGPGAVNSGYDGAQIGGDFQCHDNTAACIANDGTVGGNVQVSNNVSGNQSQIFANSIAKNLQCQGNSPAPIGGGNTVAGNAEGQCANFPY